MSDQAGKDVEVSVIIAEDETLIRLDLVETLTEMGFSVLAAVANGQAAVDAARQYLPDFILMDISMPVRDGISAAEEIMNEGIAPVIMLTAFTQSTILEQAASAGAFGYLVKPLRAAELLPAITMARSRWSQFMELGQELDRAKGRQEAGEVINKAKNELMKARNLDEAEAYALLRSWAMDRRKTLAEVSSQVVAAMSRSDFGPIS